MRWLGFLRLNRVFVLAALLAITTVACAMPGTLIEPRSATTQGYHEEPLPFSEQVPFQDLPGADGEEVDDDDTSSRDLPLQSYCHIPIRTRLHTALTVGAITRTREVNTPPPRS
ncbi:MAG: hypothetical protein AB7K37_01475 [Cyclobacteriaceae bacterium]